MIKGIHIRNYKSIVDMNVDLSRFNVLIGANGSGKSNILEAIAIAAAASSNKLDYEYFANRGIRVTDERLMTSAFDDVDEKDISVIVTNTEGEVYTGDLHYNPKAKPPMWENKALNLAPFLSLLQSKAKSEYKYNGSVRLSTMIDTLSDIQKNQDEDVPVNIKTSNEGEKINYSQSVPELNRFIIYSLEESKLRQADSDNRTFPLGKNGEGLFAYLRDISKREEGARMIAEIKENLRIFDWFEDISIPQNQLSSEYKINISDSYLSGTLNIFDQRSANEGFLYLLFYLTLIISDDTPAFFAVENIDTGFNPKLCREVISHLAELAKKHKKQIVATTHNPCVLDGLNLADEAQKLIVVRRNIDGYTITNEVKPKSALSIPLSEAWQRGYIGGLPNNF